MLSPHRGLAALELDPNLYNNRRFPRAYRSFTEARKRLDCEF